MPSPLLLETERRFAEYPGAESPIRQRKVSSNGVGIAVSEWGDETAPPVLLAHGGFDFAATFSVFAPILARAGMRVVAFDQRGHGDSDHAKLYSWGADLRDTLAVLNSVSHAPIPIIGHSKGGSLLTQFAQAYPHRVSHLINIDGMPSRRRHPDVSNHERSKLLDKELVAWLDHRRRSAELVRKPGELEDLARRRGRMNPRLEHAWLCYLVTRGARRDTDGWRWKIDPSMRMGGFGPWSPNWELQRLPGLTPPLLGILAVIPEQLGWETRERDLRPYLPRGTEIISFEKSGHFVHIEFPQEVARSVLDFLS
ncbi:MAG: alpha/beta hydrolase [Deltaproteobacteria bacterium]|nr:alpha/beta hydrolase [Deltaproteobacteria bacterium]